jgi:soluble lytic murein transglycosylase-like protein
VPWLQVIVLPLLGLQALAMGLVFFLGSPVALLIDLISPRRRFSAGWVVGFMLLALLVTAAAWGLARHTDEPDFTWAGGIIPTYYQVRDELEDLPYSDLIRIYAARNDLDPALLAALVRLESNFNANAVSPAGARGLMQILPSTWRYLYPDSTCDGEYPPPSRGSDCIFEPSASLRIGAMYFRRMLTEFEGDVVLAVAAYNAGPSAVRRLGDSQTTGIPPFRETRQYVGDVLHWWASLRGEPDDIEITAGLDWVRRAAASAPVVSTGLWVLFCLWTIRRLPWTLQRDSSRSISEPPA